MSFRWARVGMAWLMGLLLAAVATPGLAQTSNGARSATRLAILTAEDRRAASASDAAIIRSGLRSGDPQTARLAVRAAGRLERPELIPAILPLLHHSLPEVRAEAATALGQASQGLTRERTPTKVASASLDMMSAALAARLRVEAESSVRSALAETIGRLPYGTADQVAAATAALLDFSSRSQSAEDRLGVALGLEAIVRVHGKLVPPSSQVGDLLRGLLSLTAARANSGPAEPVRDARVRRLALTALIEAEAADGAAIRAGATDRDSQVRRLAMKALSNPRAESASLADILDGALADLSPMVRLEALRAIRARLAQPVDHGTDHEGEPGVAGGSDPRRHACEVAVRAASDPEPHVALTALDSLADCSSSSEAVDLLEREAGGDPSPAGAPRGWHRAAHALVSLAAADPERAASSVERHAASQVWQLRMYAARAAARRKDRATLDRLAGDQDDNVAEAALEGLSALAGHAADPAYLAALQRTGYQAVRAAALALAGTPRAEAVPVLQESFRRLTHEGRDNSRDVRTAIAATLQGLGAGLEQSTAHLPASPTDLSSLDLAKLTAARARVTIRDVGVFELALLATEAPVTAFRFAALAESGYYNGLTFHRVEPNFVIQGGSPGANEYIGDARFMRDEVGQWPHVRGAVGISTRGRDTGDAQFFIDLVDNPRLNHEYTVFAQVLNGMDVVDAILEGDIIDRIEILAR